MIDDYRFIRKLFSTLIIFLMVLPNFIIPVSAATEANIVFTYNFDGVQVNDVDTNIDGTITFAGLENGSIISMDNTGKILYNYLVNITLNPAIKKIKSDELGNIVYLTKNGDIGYIDPAGILYYSKIAPLSTNVSDIDIGRTDQLFWRIENNTMNTTITGRDRTTQLFLNVTNVTGNIIWSSMAYDSRNGLLVFSNTSNYSMPSNKIYLYNVTNYTGWLNFNPTKSPKNVTLTLLDSFPYRQNISFNNGDTNTVNLTFIDNTSSSTVGMYSNGTYYYNVSTHGKYFLWTYGFNISTTQPMINISQYNTTQKALIISTKPTTLGDNLTFYFGRSDYTNEIVTGMWNITTSYDVVSTSSNWTAPPAAKYIYKINITGGGAGGSSGYLAGYGYLDYGCGGNASIPVTIAAKFTEPGTDYPFTIGAGGPGGVYSAPYWANGSSGSTTTAFSSSGNGGVGTIPSNMGYPPWNGQDNTRMPGIDASSGCGYGGGCSLGDEGHGYGSGGGGGQSNTPGAGSGGAGASGVVFFSYQTWKPQYFITGSSGTSPSIKTQEISTVSLTLAYVTNLALTGNVTALSIPEAGGIVGVSTAGATAGVAGKVYHQVITTTGFGAQYSGTSSTGIPSMIATADGGSYSVEARGSKTDIYSLDGTQVGTYSTGGLVNSVDLADENGLWVCSGGSDGIFYIFDKATTSAWEVYYQGESEASILSVAMSERGEYAAVGRNDGTFEYYEVQSSTGSSSTSTVFSVDVFVTRGGSPSSNTNVTITEVSSSQVPTGTNASGKTDALGKYVFTATEQNYYSISVNDGEATQTYRASTVYKVVSINLPYPLMTRAFQYSALYDDNTHTITSTYSDVNSADVNISIIDSAAKTMVYSADYIGTTGFTNNYVVPDANKSYKVVFNFTRTTGAVYSDTIYVQSPFFNSIPKNTSDPYTLFIYAIYTLVLMVVALSIGPFSLKYGAVFLVALTFLGIVTGFLPWSLYTAGIATSAFIALLEVYRRRE